jgi:hypothetical protein
MPADTSHSGTDPRQSTWAQPVDRLKLTGVGATMANQNVEGRQLINPVMGFGQMWQKTYKIRLEGAEVTPQTLIQVWKEKFPTFWPKGNYFYGPQQPITPGEVAVLHLSGPRGINAPGGLPMISTGIMVVYADDESFSFMSPQGHMFASLITFSSYAEDATSATVAQIQALVRASDPLYEVTLRLGLGHMMEDEFWTGTLGNLATHFGAKGKVEYNRVLVDPKVQWAYAKNIWHNAAIRTTFYTLLTPFRWVKGKLKK